MSDFEMSPTDEIDFGVNWAPWLSSGETISASAWTVPAGLTKMTTPPSSIQGGVTAVWLTGGVKGQTYEVVNQITTSAGRKSSRTLLIDVTQR